MAHVVKQKMKKRGKVEILLEKVLVRGGGLVILCSIDSQKHSLPKHSNIGWSGYMRSGGWGCLAHIYQNFAQKWMRVFAGFG